MKKALLFLILIIFIIGCSKQIGEKTEPQLTQPKESINEAPEEKSKGLEKPAQEEKKQEEAQVQVIAPVIEEEVKETPANWKNFHGDVARTGFSPSKAPSKANVLWKWNADDLTNEGVEVFELNWPIISNDKVFLAIGDIISLDLTTGEKIWGYSGEKGSFFPRGLASGDGKIFATVNTGNSLKSLPPGFVYTFDEKTGKFLWKYQTKKGVSHSLPLFAEGRAFIGDDSGTVYSLDAETGKLIWQKELDAEVIHSSPAFEDGIIFIGTEGSSRSNALPSYLYALKASDGSELWKFQVDYIPGKLNLIHSTPAISEGVAYVGSENGYFYAISAEDGKLIWKSKIASGSGELIGTSAAAALGYGKVFISTYEGKFLALGQEDGKIEWGYNFGRANADSSPVLADEKVYFGVGEGGNGYFYSFNATNGEVIWKEKLGGSSGAIASGILIVQNALAEDNLQPATPVIIAFSDEGKLPLW